MEIPVYVTVEEVKRVCGELGFRDWTSMESNDVMADEARVILEEVNASRLPVSAEDFRQGLEVELEHGVEFSDANVTNNHPILTGRIVLAHLKESLDYYKRLDVAEIEGDILKAMVAGKTQELPRLYRKLAQAKVTLAQREADQLP